MRRAAALLLALSGTASAHPAPNSIVRLEFRAHAVRAQLWVPVSELEFARAADPGGDFRAYLLRHVAVETPAGAPWRVSVTATREATYAQQPYLVAELELSPPARTPPGELVLIDDAVTHEVRNHVVYVVADHGGGSDLVGALQYPARRLDVVARRPAGGERP